MQSKESTYPNSERCVFRVELLPARHGDCIWLEYGSTKDRRIVLIDGGPLSAFDNIKSRIEQLPLQSRRFELLVVSHIDSDHIAGIIQLLGPASLGATFKEIWFNGWVQLRRPIAGFSALGDRRESDARSPWEGTVLQQRIPSSGLRWNSSFGGNAICLARDKDPPEVFLEGGLQITLLSPDVQSLTKLRTAWGQALTRIGIDPDDEKAISERIQRDKRYRGPEFAALSEGLIRDLSAVTDNLDDAIANGSSIAFLAEFAGKRCAFLADAHSSVIESSFRRIAACRGERPLRIDAVKVSHHGSKGNTTRELLKLIDCKRFLISTDGSQFLHPDDETIARLVQFGSKPVILSFNYRSDRSKSWDDDALKSTLEYETIYAHEGEGLVVDLIQSP
jgi:hypothetical protein